MRKFLCTAACVLAALGLLIQTSDAAPRAKRGSPYPSVVIGPFDLGDVRLLAAGIIAGGATTGAYFAIRNNPSLKLPGETGNFSAGAFALTTVGCMALAPMIAAAIVWHTEQRPLTHREALGLGAGCVIPIIGPFLWDAAYDANPQWPGQ